MLQRFRWRRDLSGDPGLIPLVPLLPETLDPPRVFQGQAGLTGPATLPARSPPPPAPRTGMDTTDTNMSPEFAQRIFGTPTGMAYCVLAALSAFLLAAAWSDLRQRRIPNAVVFPGALLALLLHTILPAGDGFLAPAPGGLGLSGALKGLGIGLVILLPVYLSRGMGAGDVKLMAMVGAFLGPVQIWPVIFATLLAGGVLAIVMALRQRVLGRVCKNVFHMLFGGLLRLIRRVLRAGAPAAPGAVSGDSPALAASTGVRLPYGVAIAAGSVAYMLYQLQPAGLLH